MIGRFPAPWRIIEILRGFAVEDATGVQLGVFYGRADPNVAGHTGFLTMEEAQQMAVDFARLSELLNGGRTEWQLFSSLKSDSDYQHRKRVALALKFNFNQLRGTFRAAHRSVPLAGGRASGLPCGGYPEWDMTTVRFYALIDTFGHDPDRERNFMRIFAIVLFTSSLSWTSANAITCTQLKQGCLANKQCTTSYCQKVYCPGRWDECMKSGFWNGHLVSRPAEKR
jgi:hypothetical protein